MQIKKVLENIKFFWALCAILFFISGCSLIYAFENSNCKGNCSQNELDLSINASNLMQDSEDARNSFFIEIKGAVKKPGVYEVNNDSIINDAIKMAGGFKTTAYTDNINLSKKLNDEMVIYVFTKTAYKKMASTTNNTTSVCSSSTQDISNCIENKSSVIVSGEKDTNFSKEEIDQPISDIPSTLVNINTATLETLTLLNGVGESKAKSIIEYRTNNGLFNSIEDIMKVSGIGTSVYEKIKDYITV